MRADLFPVDWAGEVSAAGGFGERVWMKRRSKRSALRPTGSVCRMVLAGSLYRLRAWGVCWYVTVSYQGREANKFADKPQFEIAKFVRPRGRKPVFWPLVFGAETAED